MMKPIWKLALFFVFCLAIFLVINVPVVLILNQVALPKGIKLNDVKGQITSGHIAVAHVNNFPIRDINYEADLFCLLSLRVCYQINYQNGKATISFNPLTSNTEIRQFDVEYSLAELSPLMSQLLVKPAGELNLKFNRINIHHNNVNQIKIGHIDGLALWRNVGVVGEDINLGDYQFEVAREDNSYRFKLTDRQAALGMDGTGRLKSNGEYLLDIKIQADSGLDNSIKSMLTLAAKKKGLNEYVIYRQGQLAPHFIRQLLFSDGL
ncbi:MAG: hypothetical protein ACI9CO_000542 [Candidatus Azotimanducaceae bacterium]|jgi:hypothetical protein